MVSAAALSKGLRGRRPRRAVLKNVAQAVACALCSDVLSTRSARGADLPAAEPRLVCSSKAQLRKSCKPARSCAAPRRTPFSAILRARPAPAIACDLSGPKTLASKLPSRACQRSWVGIRVRELNSHASVKAGCHYQLPDPSFAQSTSSAERNVRLPQRCFPSRRRDARAPHAVDERINAFCPSDPRQ